jgi:hypothetical protein
MVKRMTSKERIMQMAEETSCRQRKESGKKEEGNNP